MKLYNDPDRYHFDIVMCECNEDMEIEFKDFKEHLKTEHNIPDPNGTQEMALHMDGRGFAISVYNIKVDGGPTATRVVKSTWGN